LFVFHTSDAPECPAITISPTASSATGTAATYSAMCSLNGSRYRSVIPSRSRMRSPYAW